MEQARQIRVFVSSTFLDMIEDRNELTDQAWPALRILCQSLNIDFVAVDMRWGITEDQCRRNEVIGLVLDEIEHCRPYFVAMLGERYGTILGHESFPPDLLAKEEWVDAYRDRSLTELEILHRILNHSSAAPRAFFYFRDSDYALRRGGVFVSGTPDDLNKQNALKGLIEGECRKLGFTLHKDYKSPRDLADLVLADLTAAIKADFPADSVTDSALSEQEAFAATRRRVYIPSCALYTQLDDHAASSASGLVVTGEAGFGKTALLANWSLNWRTGSPSDFVFEHYTASSPDSASHWNLMQRLVRDIKQWTGDPSLLPESREQLLGEFELWLRRLRSETESRKVHAIVILDGLDQLDDQDHARLLQWLPSSPWGGSLKLILSVRTSSTGSDAPEALADRGYRTLAVDALAEPMRHDFILKYLTRYRKTLDPHQINEIAGIRAGENPLFLKLLLDELIVTGQYGQTMSTILASYASSRDVPELFDKILVRWQTTYERDRPNLVGEALALMCCARRGLHEDELLRCLRDKGQNELPFAVWSPLRFALWESLTIHGGVLNFGHEYMRKAVERRFLQDGALTSEFRRRLADEFDCSPPTPRSCEEFPWLLFETKQFARLRNFLLKREPFLLLSQYQNADLFTYWQKMDTPDRVGPAYEAAFNAWKQAGPPKDERQQSLDAFDLAKFLDSLGASASAERLVRISLAAMERYSGSDAPELAQVYRTLARLLKQARKFSEAASCLQQALTINEKWYGEDDPVIAEILESIAQLLDAMMQFDQAIEFAKRASTIYERKGDMRAVGKTLVSIASIYMNAGQMNLAAEALAKAQTAAHLREFGPSEALAMYFSYQGEIQASKKQFAEAVKNYRESAETLRLLYGKSNLAVLRQINNLATIYLDQGQLKDGLDSLQECITILAEISDSSNPEYGIACSNLSCALSGVHEYAKALTYSERAVNSLAPFGRQPRGSIEFAAALNHLALALLRSGRAKEAIEAWCGAVRQMLVAIRIGAPSAQDLRTLMSNAVYGLREAQLGGSQTYELLAPIFEKEQMLDIQTDLARQMGGEVDPLKIPVRFLPQISVDLLPLDSLTSHQVLRKEIARQIDFHVGRVEAGPHVPLALCRQTRAIVEPCLDAIAFKALEMEHTSSSDQHFRYSESENEVLFLASIFNYDAYDVRAFFVRHSNERGFGYISYLIHWINNWPSPSLKMIFHLIIYRQETHRMYHSCFWDNARGATGPKRFSVLPIELLTPNERRQAQI
jgi:tetratricopeptide (TPR) repeat protein